MMSIGFQMKSLQFDCLVTQQICGRFFYLPKYVLGCFTGLRLELSLSRDNTTRTDAYRRISISMAVQFPSLIKRSWLSFIFSGQYDRCQR
jgi:hypothetical protein